MARAYARAEEHSPAGGDPRSPPQLSAAQKQEAKSLLKSAFTAAVEFNGTEAAEEKLFNPLILYDEFVQAIQDGTWANEDLERVIAKVSFPDHPPEMPLTIEGFLETASRYYQRLKEASIRGDIIPALPKSIVVKRDERHVFIKTDDGALRPLESDHPIPYEIRTQPRLALLIEHLRNDGVNGQPIYTDDLVIRMGATSSRMLRKLPYNIIQIPRLNMEIAVCDQVGEITFVKKGTIGPEFWVFMSKDRLKTRNDIEPVEFKDEQRWWSGIAEALAIHATPGPKINVASWAERKSNLDFDLVKESLLAHRLTTGEWLSVGEGRQRQYVLEHGPYAGLTSVGALDVALSAGHRGLPGGSSIAKLNAEISKEHGLDYYYNKFQDQLDMEKVKASLLAHRLATGAWLSLSAPDNEGRRGRYVLEHGFYAGQITVSALDTALSAGKRGLPGGSSIAKLNAAISDEHGLDYFNHLDQDPLDMGLIKESLLAHRLATGRWLAGSAKAEDGGKGSFVLAYGPYAGQITSGALEAALVHGVRGLPGGSSVARLNEEISQAHGLDYVNVLAQEPLDLELVKASLRAHYEETGSWLSSSAAGERGTRGSYILEYGPYAGRLSSAALESALKLGLRGLPGNSSVAQLNEELARERGLEFFNAWRRPDLDLQKVKSSLLAHRLATGKWLSHMMSCDGGTRGSYVLEYGLYAGEITAGALNAALSTGGRGLPGGMTIAQLNEELSAEHDLDYVNPKKRKLLDIELVKESIAAHYRETGKWLTNGMRGDGGTSGSYILEHGPYAGHITVSALDAALAIGKRGLPGGSSIAKLKQEIIQAMTHAGPACDDPEP